MQYLLLPDVNICQFFYFSSKHKLIIYNHFSQHLDFS